MVNDYIKILALKAINIFKLFNNLTSTTSSSNKWYIKEYKKDNVSPSLLCIRALDSRADTASLRYLHLPTRRQFQQKGWVHKTKQYINIWIIKLHWKKQQQIITTIISIGSNIINISNNIINISINIINIISTL